MNETPVINKEAIVRMIARYVLLRKGQSVTLSPKQDCPKITYHA